MLGSIWESDENLRQCKTPKKSVSCLRDRPTSWLSFKKSNNKKRVPPPLKKKKKETTAKRVPPPPGRTEKKTKSGPPEMDAFGGRLPRRQLRPLARGFAQSALVGGGINADGPHPDPHRIHPHSGLSTKRAAGLFTTCLIVKKGLRN